MCSTSCSRITSWLAAVFCSLLLAAAQVVGAVKTYSNVPGPTFVLNDNLKTSIWWAVAPYFSSDPNVAFPANVVANPAPDGVETPVDISTKSVRVADYSTKSVGIADITKSVGGADDSTELVDIADNAIKSVDAAGNCSKVVDVVGDSTMSVASTIFSDLSPDDALVNVMRHSRDEPGKSQNSNIDGADDSLKGSSCQSMSSPGDGVCTPINDCLMYDDIKSALINNTTLPYYFDSVHDKMACGFPDGANTLICCDEAPLEIPPSINILPPPYCGVQVTSTTRVVGGKPVNIPGTYPWLTELGYNRTNGNQSWECAGALITERHVLTVAHCAFPKGLVMTKARIGALTLDSTGSDYWQERTVIEVRAHHEYNSSTKKHDIAIAVLANKVELTRYVHPICLPFTTEMRKMNFEKKRPFIAGWGRVSYAGVPSDRLLQIQLAVRTNDDCQGVYKKWNRMIYPTQMCAGEGDGSHDACRGDSGAPLMQPIGNFYYVIGLISFGYYCAVKGYPSVNTRVTEYIDWIAENIYDNI